MSTIERARERANGFGNRSSALRFALPVAVGLAAAACGRGQAEEPVQDSPADDAYRRTVNVEVIEVQPSDFASTVRLVGAVDALHDVTLSAEEDGVIQRFFVEKGQRVSRGQAIAKIGDRVLQAQVAEAEATARAARDNYERRQRLFRDEGIGTEAEFVAAEAQADAAAARAGALRARLERTTVRAPVGGIFDARYVDAGEMVGSGDQIGRIIDASQVKVIGGVPERYAADVRAGGLAEIRLDLFPGRVFEGEIAFVATAVEPESRTFEIEILLENPDQLIKPQMVAAVELPTRALEGVLIVPQDALLRVEDGYQILVVREVEGELEAAARRAELGPSAANSVVIESGLAAGDRVIVRGQQQVDPGDRVRLIESSDRSDG
jgi:RND family efflux transporter MFP subunit